MGDQVPSRNRVLVPARQATQPGGICSLKLILGPLKSLKIRALDSNVWPAEQTSLDDKTTEFCPGNQTPMFSWPDLYSRLTRLLWLKNIRVCPVNQVFMFSWPALYDQLNRLLCLTKHQNTVQVNRPLYSADHDSMISCLDFCRWQNVRICPANQVFMFSWPALYNQLNRLLCLTKHQNSVQTPVAEKTQESVQLTVQLTMTLWSAEQTLWRKNIEILSNYSRFSLPGLCDQQIRLLR